MKRFDFPLDKFQLGRLIGPFREKGDIVSLWMNTIKTISTYAPPEAAQICGHLVLHVDKMSRLFIQSDQKSFSTSFPFSIYEREDGLEFGSKSCSNIDSKVSSDILALINAHNILSSRNVVAFADPLLDLTGDQEVIWELLRDLMTCDDGYIRLDHDPANENGALHPLDHIDIFYSQAATFKIGLGESLSLDDFHDVLNIKSNCHFLSKS